jgi:predicted AAA+ superfamily ATPase
MLEKVSDFMLSNCGSITSANKISEFVKAQHRKIAVDTVQNYMTYTRHALLMHQVKRYDLKGKRILESLEKYYPCDHGLRYAIMGYPPENIPGNLENIVFLELLSKGYVVFVGRLNGTEVDFIAEKSSEKIYIQVCMSLKDEKTIEREYRSLETIHDHFPKIVLSLDEGFETSHKGIRWMNIKEFLKSTPLYEGPIK